MNNDNKTTPYAPFSKGELIPLPNDNSIDSPLEKGDEGVVKKNGGFMKAKDFNRSCVKGGTKPC